MTRSSVLFVAAALIGANAGATVFPDTDGSHDISRAEAWGGTLPTAAEFTQDGNLTASADATFGTFTVKNGAQVAFDFLSSPLRSVSLTGAFSVIGSQTSADFRGGVWTTEKNLSLGYSGNLATDAVAVFSNAQVNCSKMETYGSRNRLVFTGADTRLTTAYTGTYNIFDSKNSELLLTDGAKWAHDNNHLYLTISSAASNNVFAIEKGAEFTTAKTLYVGYNANEGRNRVEVRDGGYLKANSITIQRAGQELVISNATVEAKTYPNLQGVGCRMALMGESAKLQFTHSSTFSLFAAGARDGVLEVSNGAVWEFNTNNIYTIANNSSWVTNSVFRICDGGRFQSVKPLYIGYSPLEMSNRVEVLSGGELRVKSVDVNRNAQALIVSNGTVTCSTRVNVSGTDCRFVMMGEEAKYEPNVTGTFALLGSGTGNGMIVSEGATFAYTNNGAYLHIADGSGGPSNNFARVERGGRLNFPKGFYIGYNRDCDNRVEVLDGGRIDASFVSLGSTRQALVVSNGTVNSASTLTMGFSWGDQWYNTNCAVVVSGTTPRLTAKTSFTLRNSATLRFEVSVEGYATVPVEAEGDFYINAGTAIEIEADAYQQQLRRHGNVVLASWGGYGSVSAEVLEAANAELAPKRMQLVVRDKKLILSVVAVNAGAVIIIR